MTPEVIMMGLSGNRCLSHSQWTVASIAMHQHCNWHGMAANQTGLRGDWHKDPDTNHEQQYTYLNRKLVCSQLVRVGS